MSDKQVFVLRVAVNSKYNILGVYANNAALQKAIAFFTEDAKSWDINLNLEVVPCTLTLK
jgi:hypothetical protein